MAENKTPIAKAYVQVLPSTEGIRGKLEGAFGSEGTSAGSIFGGNLVGTIKGIFAAAGIGTIVKETLLSGADLQQSLGGVETLFADSADAVIANANNAYKTAGMSANEYMETVTSFSASLLQGLSGDTQAAAGVADMALTDMADNVNKFGTDMALVQNAYQGFAKQNYTMLDNLKLGYGGTKTEMERLLADAQELTGVKYDISNLADVYEAIHVIQEEMGITGTTAKESSETFAGSLAAMKSAASNVLANLALGEDIRPSLAALGDTVFTFVGGNLLPMAGNLLSGLPEVITQSMGMAIRGLNIAADNADELLAQGLELAGDLATGIIEGAPYLIEAGWNLLKSMGSAILRFDWLETVDGLATNIRDSLSLAAAEILGTDGSIVDAVRSAIADRFPQVNQSGSELVLSLVNGLIGDISEVISAGSEIAIDLLEEFAEHLPEMIETGLTYIGELAAGMILSIPELLSAAGEIAGDILDKFAEWDWNEIGANVASGIADGLLAGATAVWDAVVSVASSALDAAKDFLGIASPSKRARDEIGKQIPPGIAVGVEENADVVSDVMGELSELTMDAFHADLTAAVAPDEVSVQNVLRLDSAYKPQVATTQNKKSVKVDVHVYPTEGMDVKALAKEVAREIMIEVENEEDAA